MRHRWHRTSAVGIAVAILPILSFPASVTAQGSVGFLAPGEYLTMSHRVFFFNFTSDQQVFIGVTDQLEQSVINGARNISHTTSLFVSVFNATVSASDCYLLAPSDFTFGTSTAAVHKTVTDATEPCFPGQTNTLPTPFSADVTWTGTDPIAYGRGESTFTCGGHEEQGPSSGTTQTGSATATLSPILADSLFSPAHQFLQSGETRTEVDGVRPDACVGPIGIAEEPMFPAAGEYSTSTIFTGFFAQDPTGRNVSININKESQQSRPEVGAASQSTDIIFNLSIQDGFSFQSGCFVLGPSEFTSNSATSAKLSITLTSSTPTCGGFPPTLDFPLTVNVAWTGTGPVATARSDATVRCGAYAADRIDTQMVNPADIKASLTPLLSEPLAGHDLLQLFGKTIDAEGTKTPGCVTATGLPL